MSRAGLWTIDPPQDLPIGGSRVAAPQSPALLFRLAPLRSRSASHLYIAVLAMQLDTSHPGLGNHERQSCVQPTSRLLSCARGGSAWLAPLPVGCRHIIMLTACFPQDRTMFLIKLALWGAACSVSPSTFNLQKLRGVRGPPWPGIRP